MKRIPPSVQKARREGSKEELVALSKKGAAAKELKKKFRMLLLLKGVREMVRQGNEHICPID